MNLSIQNSAKKIDMKDSAVFNQNELLIKEKSEFDLSADNERVFTPLSIQRQNFELMIEKLRIIDNAKSFKDILSSIISCSLETVNGNLGAIYLFGKDKKPKLKLALNSSFLSVPYDKIKIDQQIIRKVQETGASYYSEDPAKKISFNREGSFLRVIVGFIFCSALVVDSKLIGMLYVESQSLSRHEIEGLIEKFEILSLYSSQKIKNVILQRNYHKIKLAGIKSSKLLYEARTKIEMLEHIKDEFLAKISHEIRTPLNIIINYADLIKDELREFINEETELYFNAIEVDSKRLIRTVDLVLNMSQLKNNNFKVNYEIFDIVNNVLIPVVSEFKIDAKDKSLKLIFEDKSNNKVISADKYVLKQIFSNLIDNAIKFTDHGFINVKAFNEKDFLCISVHDTGKGISESYLRNICEPFSQEDHGFARRHQGNGLGLAVVKLFLNLIDGKLFVDSRPGHGSIFTVKFRNLWR